MKKEYFKLAIRNLKKRKLRSWLTILGIFISIATLFTLVSLSLGLQDAVEEQFRLLGADKFFVQPGTGFLGPPGSVGGTILTEEDIKIINNVNGVKDFSYYTIGNAKVEYFDEERFFTVAGIPLENQEVYIESGSFKIKEGRFFREEQEDSVLLGDNFKTKNLLGKSIQEGDKIIINGVEFKVRGILEPIGNPQDDSIILMEIKNFRKLFQIPSRVDFIIVQIDEGANIQEVVERTERNLRKARGVTEKTQDFSISTPEELLNSFQLVLDIITYFLAGIAAISLFVGGVGIANTMYTSVLERTKEIGVMKAIGARNSDILWIFLIESGLLGLVGALAGIIFGYSMSRLIEFIAINQLNTNLLHAAAPFYLVLGCLLFGFLIGVISGVLPALQASKTNVAEALRYE